MVRGPVLGMELSPEQDLLEEVAEANWLLRKIWQSVEGVRHQTWRMAVEAERAEVQRELEEGLHDESSENSESSGSWRTALEELEERESEQWRSTVDPESEELGESGESEESEGSEPEVEKEMDKEVVDEEMTLE